uniref:Uncharacterized protein n=1 Tax=Rhizophora mucronata TaxID=61149 RepID=A0A2P2KUK0_RHIMU
MPLNLRPLKAKFEDWNERRGWASLGERLKIESLFLLLSPATPRKWQMEQIFRRIKTSEKAHSYRRGP